jgi:hypothetical protein
VAAVSTAARPLHSSPRTLIYVRARATMAGLTKLKFWLNDSCFSPAACKRAANHTFAPDPVRWRGVAYASPHAGAPCDNIHSDVVLDARGRGSPPSSYDVVGLGQAMCDFSGMVGTDFLNDKMVPRGGRRYVFPLLDLGLWGVLCIRPVHIACCQSRWFRLRPFQASSSILQHHYSIHDKVCASRGAWACSHYFARACGPCALPHSTWALCRLPNLRQFLILRDNTVAVQGHRCP